MSRALVLRIALILSATIVVLIVGVPLWTAAPDSVQVTVTHHAGDSSAPAVVTTIYDRTVHDAALAQRLQRDLAALPTTSPFGTSSCPGFYTYDTYSLTWSRSGLFVEQAFANPPGCGALWIEDTIITHTPVSDQIYLDLHTAMGVPLPLCGKPIALPTCRSGP